VAHPQVAAFARLADGSAEPTRRIEGQTTLLGRTMHGIEYDEVNDEIIVPQQFAQAIMVFRGGANGPEQPIRVIQGSRTQLSEPDRMALDPVNDEIYVPDAGKILVFPREADGNVAPIRVLEGIDGRVAIDTENDLLVSGSDRGIFIFERTAQGKAKPLRVIKGPDVLLRGLRAVRVYPPRGLIFAAIRGQDDKAPYVGVWNIHEDDGNVPPRWTFAGPGEVLVKPFGMALDTKNQTVIVSDMKMNSVLSFHVPELF
jgi:hypothetical protein